MCTSLVSERSSHITKSGTISTSFLNVFFHISRTRSETEVGMNIEDLDLPGLSLDEEDKILQTGETKDINMMAMSSTNPPGLLAQVKLLSLAILSLSLH